MAPNGRISAQNGLPRPANDTYERNLRPRGPIAGMKKAEMFEGQPLAYPLLLLIVPLFRGWLKQGLESIRSDLVSS